MPQRENERARRMVEELAAPQKRAGLSLHTEENRSVHDLVFEVLEISPATAKAGKVLFEVVDRRRMLSDEMNIPEVEHFFNQYPHLHILLRFGYTTQLYQAYVPFRDAGTRFINDTRNHYNDPATQKKYKKRDQLQEYAQKYANFPNRIQAVSGAVNTELSYWMRTPVSQEHLGPGSTLIREKEFTLGLTTYALSKELGKRKSENLKLSEYTELCQLFLWQVQEERQHAAEVTTSTSSDDHTLAKLLYEFAAGDHLPPVDVSKILSKNLEKLYASGVDMYNLFVSFFREFTQALTDAEHPGHELTAELMSELNQFTIPEQKIPKALASQPFTFQFCVGLTLRDAASNANYQEVTTRLHRLANESATNHEWYQALLTFIVQASETFEYRVLITSADTEAELFDTEKEMPEMSDLGDSLERILRAGSASHVTTIASSAHLPIEDLPLKGKDYHSYMHARRIARDSYIVNVEVVVGEGDLDDTRFLTRGKFRYQVRAEGGRTSVYLPLIDRENVSEQLNSAAQTFVQYVFHTIDLDLQEDVQARENLSEMSKIPQHKTTRPSDRAARIREYNERKAIEQQGRFTVDMQKQREEEQYVLSAAEEDAVSPYLPAMIIVSESMQREMEKRSKKGAYARIYAEAARFIEEYNTAGEIKPGRGYQLTDVYGPNGEKVLRFRVTYGIRCIVVDLGGGKALMVSAEDHDDAYGGVTDISRRVANEIAKYWRETDQG